ncbi:NAD(+)/NADH kinase [Candidatus Persebacteraceae bacterium Df01]|jgi:NAD+ kinase|uniref:NAD kinase n=1 Tax=Candidatus Doriopsillibacter californiensis TaxID=2970740 RepID=A0ABT7QM51_9GAMM|nr:NAD(+)/NADH kinase [Candidatus Persebacteraceae bacterium Df01]
MTLRRIACLGRSKQALPARELLSVVTKLSAQGIEVLFESRLAAHCDADAIKNSGVTVLSMSEVRQAEIAVVLGGDGTFLRAARHCAPLGIPLAGVNLGHLGFLTDIAYEDMRHALLDIIGGAHQLEKRFILAAQVERNGKVLEESGTIAINDIVFSRGEAGVLLGLRVSINGALAYDLRADGLIVSTPSGSTAYALAAGGPIVAPNLKAVLLVPLCPHALTYRPLALNAAGMDVTVEITKSKTAQLHLDGDLRVPLDKGDIVRVRRYAKPLRLYHPQSYDYFATLRQKLHWGN